MIGIGCIIISDLLEAFKENRYQIWAQNSPFTTSAPYKAWQQNPQQLYDALLSLILVPNFQIQNKVIDKSISDKPLIAVSVALPPMYGLLGNDGGQLTLQTTMTVDVGLGETNFNQAAGVVTVAPLKTRSIIDQKNQAVIGQTQWYDYTAVMKQATEIGIESEKHFPTGQDRGAKAIVIAAKAQMVFSNITFPPTKVLFPQSQGWVDEAELWLEEKLDINSAKQIALKDEWWNAPQVKLEVPYEKIS